MAKTVSRFAKENSEASTSGCQKTKNSSLMQKDINEVHSQSEDNSYENIQYTPIISSVGDTHRVEYTKGASGPRRCTTTATATITGQDLKVRRTHDTEGEEPQPDRIADQLIVQAEKFKARIEALKVITQKC